MVVRGRRRPRGRRSGEGGGGEEGMAGAVDYDVVVVWALCSL